jgi:hypothetical protein
MKMQRRQIDLRLKNILNSKMVQEIFIAEVVTTDPAVRSRANGVAVLLTLEDVFLVQIVDNHEVVSS